jgi:hypothetical protein
LPPGLVLHLGLQGDVIRGLAVGDNPYRSWPGDPPLGPLDSAPFVDALTSPTTVAALEIARARHHLVWLARTLRLHGLNARGRRVLVLARSLTPADRSAVEALARRIGRDRGLAAATSGVGIIDPAVIDQARADGKPPGLTGGPVVRASGLETDARTNDPAYADLEFEPVVHAPGDARARLRQRVAEATQALALAERAGDRERAPGWPVEGPRGALVPGQALPSAALVALVPELVDGMEWGDAVATIASLDLDLEEAAFTPARVHAGVPAGTGGPGGSGRHGHRDQAATS